MSSNHGGANGNNNNRSRILLPESLCEDEQGIFMQPSSSGRMARDLLQVTAFDRQDSGRKEMSS